MFGMIPFTREENSLWNYLDNMEKNLFTGFGDMSQFRCDIQDKGDHYLMEAELPGFQKEDISLDLNGDNMVITARHNSEKEEKGEGNYLRRERKYGSYSRSFNVSGINTEGIKAAYNNGILEVPPPKRAGRAPATRTTQRGGCSSPTTPCKEKGPPATRPGAPFLCFIIYKVYKKDCFQQESPYFRVKNGVNEASVDRRASKG